MTASPFKTIIFDFDGVVLDSASMKADAFAEVYAGESEMKRRLVREYADQNGGLSRRQTFASFEKQFFGRTADDATLDALCAAYGSLIDGKVQRTNFVRGASEAIRDLNGRCSMHVVSGAPEADVVRILRQRKMLSCFSSVAGAPKSKLDEFGRILREDGVSASSTLAIGDSLTEFEAARQLGIPFIAVVDAVRQSPFPPDVMWRPDLTTLWDDMRRLAGTG